MNLPVAQKLKEFAQDAASITQGYESDRWSARAESFLSTAIGTDAANRFASIYHSEWPQMLALRRGHLEGLIVMAEVQNQVEDKGHSTSTGIVNRSRLNSRKVFVVHGHEKAAKDGVARFMEKVGLQPIILHEQPNAGRTIIEKFETYSDDVAFAVVLLTPDDVGCESGAVPRYKPRARQNVIMELGYFIGRLGRTRVCALYKGDVELPSDYQGVLYVEMDDAGAWKAKLAQELVQSRITIDLAGLLGS